MKKYGLITIILLNTPCLAMENAVQQPSGYKPHTHVYGIPGQNGCGAEDWHVHEILERQDVSVPFPVGCFSDLGQTKCVNMLRTSLAEHPDHQKIVVYAVSQGTATILNYLSETNDPRIKCVILQAPLVSGNSGIIHTLAGPFMNFRRLAHSPFAYYWIPYCAKFLFPWYWPAGKQPIKTVQKINPDIPIVIVHAHDDPQLPYEGACALYYALRAQRGPRNNVYFISKERGGHLYLLTAQDKPVLDAILAKHRLKKPTRQTAAIDLKAYQPDFMQFKTHYDNLIFKEKTHTVLKYAGTAVLAAGITYLFRNRLASLAHKLLPKLFRKSQLLIT